MRSKLLLCFLLIGLSGAAFCQFEPAKQVYSAPNLKTAVQAHKTVAILPFSVSVAYKKLPKNYDSSATKSEAEQLKTNLQSSMFTYLLRKGGKYTVTFQDPTRTNALLKSHDAYNSLDLLTEDTL